MPAIAGDYQYQALHHGRRLQRAWHRMRCVAARRVLDGIGPQAVLDAGCGSGIMLRAVCAPGMAVSGVDLNAACIAFAAKYLEDLQPRLSVAGIADTGAAPCSQDLVLCCEVLEHVPLDYAATALRHFHEILAPGGHLYLTVPNSRSTWVLIECVLDAFGVVPALKGVQHVCRHTRRSMRGMVEASGFEIERMGTFNLVSPFVGSMGCRAGEWLLGLELGWLCCGGNLLYVLARKTPRGNSGIRGCASPCCC